MIKYNLFEIQMEANKMSYRVTISGGTILEECIQHVAFKVDIPNDYSRSTTPRNSMIITGQIDINEGTAFLYQWSLLPGTNLNCYKEVTVEQYQKNLLVRKVSFCKAFVVDYSESYSNYDGAGSFTLYIRQFVGKDISLDTQETQKISKTETTDNEANTENEQKPIIQETKSSLPPITSNKSNISFTDRIAKQKDLQDNISQDGYDEIKKFREQSGFQPYSDDSGDTVAMVEIEGQKFFGVNSSITKELQAETKELRQKWFEKVNWVPPKKNVPKHLGHVQSLTHAESHSLIVAYERLGKLPKNMAMHVDRKTCNMCKGEMPALLKHIGVEELKIFSGGSTKPMIIKAVQ